MMTYLMSRGFSPSFVRPSMISGSVAHAKLVSMTMIPALVWTAHEECWRVPSQYRLSKTLCGDAYHVLRFGVWGPPPGLGAARPGPASPAVATGAVAGRQRLMNVLRKSSPAAALA